MTQTERSIKFWQKINKHFPHNDITSWIKCLETGRADWFRNYGLVNITLANSCRVERFGFDQEKFEKLQDWAEGILNHYGLNAGMMQN